MAIGKGGICRSETAAGCRRPMEVCRPDCLHLLQRIRQKTRSMRLKTADMRSQMEVGRSENGEQRAHVGAQRVWVV